MALNGDALGAALATASGSTDAAGIAAWKAIGNAIVKHIVDNGEAYFTDRHPPFVPIAFAAGSPVTGTANVK